MVPALLLLLLVGCSAAETAGADAPAPPAQAGTPAPGPAGSARVIDGDTLALAGRRIRLHGIDAPERGQACGGRAVPRWDCGAAAAEALAGLAAGPVRCRAVDRDRYGRVVATCRGAGRDLGAAMVAGGWAVAYRRYATRYVNEERAARRARRGLWRGAFVTPHDWRRGTRLAAGSPPPDAGCRIKGNVSGNGRIYHLPGSRWYARTRIDTDRGERWFCSEAAARAAGWRPPRG